METFITVNEHGQPYKKPMPTKRLLAYNGFTLFIHGKSGFWNATELKTGLSVAGGFKTIKALQAELENITSTVSIPMFVERQLKWLNGCESWNK